LKVQEEISENLLTLVVLAVYSVFEVEEAWFYFAVPTFLQMNVEDLLSSSIYLLVPAMVGFWMVNAEALVMSDDPLVDAMLLPVGSVMSGRKVMTEIVEKFETMVTSVNVQMCVRFVTTENSEFVEILVKVEHVQMFELLIMTVNVVISETLVMIENLEKCETVTKPENVGISELLLMTVNVEMIHNVKLSVTVVMNENVVMSQTLLLIENVEIPEILVMTENVEMFETLIITVISQLYETRVVTVEDTLLAEAYGAVVDVQMDEILMKIWNVMVVMVGEHL